MRISTDEHIRETSIILERCLGNSIFPDRLFGVDLYKDISCLTMEASSRTLVLEKPNSTDDWTVVLPRRGKQRRKLPIMKSSEQQTEPISWVPTDLEKDAERESKLMQKMQNTLEKLEKSRFFLLFMDQIQTSETADSFLNVLGSEQNLSMVIYGIGSIESNESPRLQLSLAILMKRRLSWIGDIEVFDPIISLTESKVLQDLGCSVLSVNEQGRRQAVRPILFFMPHCEAELYDNLLRANWNYDMLNRIILFGNSFEKYEKYQFVIKNSKTFDSRKHLLAVRRFAKEYHIDTVSDDYFRAFHGLSWHFFKVDSISNLQSSIGDGEL